MADLIRFKIAQIFRKLAPPARDLQYAIFDIRTFVLYSSRIQAREYFEREASRREQPGNCNCIVPCSLATLGCSFY